MSNNYFYIDENCFMESKNVEKLEYLLKKLLSIFRLMFDEEKEIVITVPYWKIILNDNKTLIYQIVFEDFPCGLSREERIELLQFFNRCQLQEHTVSECKVLIDDVNYNTLSSIFSLACLHDREKKNYPMFLFRLSHNNSSSAIFETEASRRECFLLADVDCLDLYYRNGLKALLPKGKDFLLWAKKSFRKLDFHPSVDVDKLHIDLNLHIRKVISHLEFLNDNYKIIAIDVNWDVPSIKSRAEAYGVDFSDESRNTKKDKAKISLRDVEFTIDDKTKVFRCSLHTKILPTAGRIHFYNPGVETGQKILIGIMHKHLPT